MDLDLDQPFRAQRDSREHLPLLREAYRYSKGNRNCFIETGEMRQIRRDEHCYIEKLKNIFSYQEVVEQKLEKETHIIIEAEDQQGNI